MTVQQTFIVSDTFTTLNTYNFWEKYCGDLVINVYIQDFSVTPFKIIKYLDYSKNTETKSLV